MEVTKELDRIVSHTAAEHSMLLAALLRHPNIRTLNEGFE
jgi:hypothetical protein